MKTAEQIRSDVDSEFDRWLVARGYTTSDRIAAEAAAECVVVVSRSKASERVTVAASPEIAPKPIVPRPLIRAHSGNYTWSDRYGKMRRRRVRASNDRYEHVRAMSLAVQGLGEEQIPEPVVWWGPVQYPCGHQKRRHKVPWMGYE